MKPAPVESAAKNRLAEEKSPYLLQHQFNPVDWYPWGEPAFAAARTLRRPIFLSIGYSTCHWCHVMERESFESPEVARFLNEHFISIKVDREERPDIDKIYMNFVQATTGQGGWPLSAFLTPDLKPFFGGTYFPPSNQYGRPGFLQLLQQIQQLWTSRHEELTGSAADLHQRLAQALTARHNAPRIPLSAQILQRAGLALKEQYDPVNGGFGRAPKFPQPSQPQFLLRYARRFKDEEAQRMVLHTCDRMAAGGIHDQLGGGFARYSVDAQWLVPHFEKMLYDNAQLAQVYLDAFLVSGDAKYAGVVRDILDYVLRDMTHPEGGFYSAEDADSEGHEGKFYCWTREELSQLLTPEEFNVATRFYGVSEAGNFVDHSHPQPLTKQNVLSVAKAELAQADRPLLDSARNKMLATRAGRVRPHLDDKILASWNGLMLGALARASAILGETRYLQAAEKNLTFLQNKLWDPSTATLYHRWRDGERDSVQLLTAYSFTLAGVLELYEATLRADYLQFALSLSEALLARFYDAKQGGFWQAVPGRVDLILSIKDDYDGAEPSGASVACLALLKLGRISGNPQLVKAADQTLQLFSATFEQLPQAVPYMLQALDFSLNEPARAVVAGDPARPETVQLVQLLHSFYVPNKVVMATRGPVDPFVRNFPDQPASVYLCSGTTCQAPASDPTQIRKSLEQIAS